MQCNKIAVKLFKSRIIPKRGEVIEMSIAEVQNEVVGFACEDIKDRTYNRLVHPLTFW
jgi:hypothetical protein